MGKYKDALYRVLLTHDGTEAPYEPFILHNNGGLDVTLSPDGKLFTCKYKGGKVRYIAPNEPASEALVVKSVFPRRGGQAGGTTISIYGENFDSGTPSVAVGGSPCPVLTVGAKKITCTLPGGSGTADILVTSGNETGTFSSGYRYITGVKKTQAPFSSPSSEPSVATSSQDPSIAPSVFPSGNTVEPSGVPSQSPSTSALPMESPSSRPSSSVAPSAAGMSPMPSLLPSISTSPVALINCGGGAFTDSEGNEWEADGYYQPSEPDSLSIQTMEPILGTDDDALYSSARMFRRNRPGPYLYEIPIPAAGEYNVTLHFAEIDPSRAATGLRVANVVVEGTALESGFDIFEAAGGAGFTAVTLSTTVFANETLTVAFEVVKFNPIVSAIAVYTA